MSNKQNLHRNIKDLISDQGIEVDAGALWVLSEKEKRMILVDDDEYITTSINLARFEKV